MKRLITVLLLIALCPLQACGMWYSAEAIEAWVVDAETNKPIEGVIVVAHWQLYGGLHPDNAGELTILETVTDKAGRFHFPAWGPKFMSSWLFSNARLTYMDPEILLFKSGFKYERITNELIFAALSDNGPSLRRSQWNGKTIKMEKFKGTTKEYSGDLSFLNGLLRFVEENCNWKKTPMILIALDRQRQIFQANGIDSGIYSLDYFDGLSDKKVRKCGLPRDFFKGQKK